MTEESLIAAAKRPGIYARGSDTVEQILAAALRVLIEEGASAFTLRRVAAECGMKVGNLSYHFPKKQLLIQLLLGELLISYEGLLDRTVRIAGLTPEDRLVATMVLCMDDILTKRTTHLFTRTMGAGQPRSVRGRQAERLLRSRPRHHWPVRRRA
jgi:AcrR family transcriptional regulator